MARIRTMTEVSFWTIAAVKSMVRMRSKAVASISSQRHD